MSNSSKIAPVLVACVMATSVAFSQTIYVDESAPGVVEDGLSWDTAYTDLQSALAIAASGDEIRIAQGTYFPGTNRSDTFQVPLMGTLVGGYAGCDETTPGDRDIAGYPTILSGDIGTPGDELDNSYNVVTGANGTTLDGLTITDGYADGSMSSSRGQGGCIRIASLSSMTIIDCTITNSFGRRGGGIYAATVGTLTITRTTFSGNDCSSGGGIYTNSVATLALTDCDFTDNTAGSSGGLEVQAGNVIAVNCSFTDNVASNYGGGVNIFGTTGSSFTTCTFTSNTASTGGGLYGDNNSSLVIDTCTFDGNSATGSGGGMHHAGYNYSMNDCVFTDNVAASQGGAVYQTQTIGVISGCTVSGNSAQNGGGFSFVSCSGGPTLFGCVFEENVASANGGALRVWSTTPTIDCCVFLRNATEDRGGAIYTNFAMTYRNSNFIDNTAITAGGAVSEYNCTGTMTNCILQGNLPESIENYLGGFINVSNCCIDEAAYAGASGNIDDNPLFVDRANDDFHLLPGSPCIDSGYGTGASDQDLDGEDRWNDPGTDDSGSGAPMYIDMGAFEFQGTTPDDWIYVLTPSTGTAWRVGDTVDIEWISSNSFAQIDIELDRNGDDNWETLFTATDDDGVESWTVTDNALLLPQMNCILRVTESGSALATNDSYGFTIFSGVWHVDGTAAAGGDGLDWATAFQHPQDALDAAAPGHEIWVAQGIYTTLANDDALLTLKDGVEVYGGFDGTEGVRGLRDPSGNTTTLYGEDAHRIILASETTDAVLDGFALDSGAALNGAGLYADTVTNLTVSQCSFTSNMATSTGAAIYASVGPITVSDCTFDSNHANNYGGAIRLYQSSGSIADSTFNANSTNSDGGAVHLQQGDATISGCVFTGNVSGSAGGAVGSLQWPGRIENCLITGNQAYLGGGVASYYETVVNCTITGNTALAKGGGLYVSSNANVTNCIIWDNAGPQEIHGATVAVTYSCVEGGHTGTGNLDGDPLFTDAAGGDYTLSAGSPCIDAANATPAPADDKDALGRSDDGNIANTGVGSPTYVDLGAHEFQGTTASSITVVSPHSRSAWRIGDEVTIRWTATTDVGAVLIELSRNDAWETITPTVLTARTATWTVTDGAVPQDQCVIRVSASPGPNPSDDSPSFPIYDGVWYVDASASAGGNGTSWATAFQHPQDAIEAATTGDEVWVCRIVSGYYGRLAPAGQNSTVVTLKDGVAVYGGFVGGETALGQRDPAANVTLLNGTQEPGHIAIGAQNATLDGFTLMGGNSDQFGGGMYNFQVSGLTIRNCVFTGNSGHYGGGMYCYASSPNIQDCSFEMNISATNGGALSSNQGSPMLTDCVFEGNHAEEKAGAFYTVGTCTSVFDSCTFLQNTATQRGGAIYSDNGTLTLSECVFQENSGVEQGGAIYYYGSTLVLQDCTLSENHTDGSGGAVHYFSGGTSSRISGCTFEANMAGDAGGHLYTEWASPEITNSTFSGGYATTGGAIHVKRSSPHIINCAIAVNEATGYGGALHIEANGPSQPSDPVLTNCILWDNIGDMGTGEIFLDIDCTCTATYNCIKGGYPGLGNIETIPAFTDPGSWNDNSTPGDTSDDYWDQGDYSLLAGSQCIDAGFDDASTPAADKDGWSRTDDGNTANIGAGTTDYVDIGAYEFQGATAPAYVTVVSPRVDSIVDAGDTLEVTWLSTNRNSLTVRIELSRDNQATWDYIDGGTGQTGDSFPWLATGPASAECCIRITEVGGTSLSDMSSAFTIREPLTLTFSQTELDESEGPLTIGTVSVPTAVTSDLDVYLDSSDTGELDLPLGVVQILTGTTSVTFDVTGSGDPFVDGPQVATVTASATAYLDDQADLTVNDTDPLMVALPTDVTEGDAAISGTITISAPAVGDQLFTLQSSDTSDLTVDASVTILDGLSSATFALNAVNDAEIDDTVTVSVTASRTGWADGSADIDVLDNEATTLTVMLPADIAETATATGTVQITGTLPTPLVIDLLSSDTASLTVDAEVTIPAGQVSASFGISGVPDTVFDGTQSVLVGASTTGFADGVSSIDVLDAATQDFAVDLPVNVTEGAMGSGTVSIPGTLGTDLVVDLTSSDTGLLTVDAQATIAAGTLSQTFAYTAVDDGAFDGTQVVTITASLAAWTDGMDTMDILDDEAKELSVTLPVGIAEGGTETGTVSIPGTFATDVVVGLSSDAFDTMLLTVSSPATITAGSTSAPFTISAIDDARFDGPQTVTITASSAGWTSGTNSIDVSEGLAQTLTLSAALSISEGQATTGTLTLPGTLLNDLIVTLSSSDTANANVPLTVTIYTGTSAATFSITAGSDFIVDGTETVTITASAAGWTDGSVTIDITNVDVAPDDGGSGGCLPGSGPLSLTIAAALAAFGSSGLRKRQRQ